MSRSMLSQLLCRAAVGVFAMVAVPAAAGPAGSGRWVGSVSKDPMTDAETAVIRSRVAVGQSVYELRLKCERPDIRVVQLAVFDSAGVPLKHVGALDRLEYRIDKAPPEFLVPQATDYANVYGIMSADLGVDRLLQAQTLALRGYRGDETPVFTFQWDQAPGLRFRQVCGGVSAAPVAKVAQPPAPAVAASATPSTTQAAALHQWRQAMISRIADAWARPPNVSATIITSIAVVLRPAADGAQVVSATLSRSSGNGIYDQSVRRAVLKASPLPMPADPAVFQDRVTFRLMVPDLEFSH